MKRTSMSVSVAAALLVLSGCGESGSGTAGSDTRSVGAFDEIEIHGALDADVTVGGKPSVVVTGDDNLVPLIETDVVGDRLVIRPTESMSRKLPMTITISTEALTELELHGASEVVATGIDADELTVELHGASEATLEGDAEELDAELHGASKLLAQKLDADEVQLQASGASSAELGEPDAISAALSGASSARYGGTPKVTEKLSGSSAISKR